MITYVSGDLFKTPARVLVNTVNTVGVMGKGVAKEFKRLFPQMFQEYRGACENKKFDIGNLFLYKTPNKWVLNFPTKRHWRNPSRPVVRSGDGLVVKRVGKGEDGNWLLLSDNPSWKPLPWPGNAEIIGEVKWMARTL